MSVWRTLMLPDTATAILKRFCSRPLRVRKQSIWMLASNNDALLHLLLFPSTACWRRKPKALLKTLSMMLAEKWQKSYSVVAGIVRSKIGIAIVCATNQCLRSPCIGFRSMSKRIDWNWDDESGTNLYCISNQSCPPQHHSTPLHTPSTHILTHLKIIMELCVSEKDYWKHTL